MKRSNFTFLFLFALLSFVSVNLDAQATSSSCINEVNVTVDADCGFVINDAVLGATGPAMMAQSVEINGVLFPMAGSGSGFSITGSLTAPSMNPAIGLPDGGSVQFNLFENADGTGSSLCWGTINFEIKSTPDVVMQTFNVMCLEPIPDLIDLDDFEDDVNGACSSPITNLTETNTVTGDACTGFTRVRTIRGTVEIEGRKDQITLAVETINEMPLDIMQTECPAGIPNDDGTVDFSGVPALADVPLGTALTIPCTVSNDADAIYAYFLAVFEDALDGQPFAEERAQAAAIVRAYPHIVKDARVETVQTGTNTTTITTTVEDSMVLIDGVWVLADVVVKEDVTTPVFTDVTIPTLIPLPKTNVSGFQGGTICNLSVKCTDRNFPGCSGPQSKTRRDWQILNWCDGIVETHVSG